MCVAQVVSLKFKKQESAESRELNQLKQKLNIILMGKISIYSTPQSMKEFDFPFPCFAGAKVFVVIFQLKLLSRWPSMWNSPWKFCFATILAFGLYNYFFEFASWGLDAIFFAN
jgi:hypothetical protein